jgi:FkbM family methyltransferase
MYSFEPFDHTSKKYRDREDIIFSNAAVWTYDGEINLFPNKRSRRPEGSTLIADKKSKKIQWKNPVTVPCINFSKWVMDNFSKDDFIILKMDIEGAEYEVLNQMIATGAIKYVDKAFVEFHWKGLGSVSEDDHKALVETLNAVSGFELLPEMDYYIKGLKNNG